MSPRSIDPFYVQLVKTKAKTVMDIQYEDPNKMTYTEKGGYCMATINWNPAIWMLDNVKHICEQYLNPIAEEKLINKNTRNLVIHSSRLI